MSTSDTTGEFRPLQYLGNKWRLLDDIESVVDAVAPDATAVADLFAGSGVVARRLAGRRSVVAADVQEYSRVVTDALLHPVPGSGAVHEALVEALRTTETSDGRALTKLLKFEAQALMAASDGLVDDLGDLLEVSAPVRQAGSTTRRGLAGLVGAVHDDTVGDSGRVLQRLYGGLYFSYQQAVDLDRLSQAVRALPAPQRRVGLAALIGTASQIASTVGNQFAQPVRPRDKGGQAKSGTLQAVARRRHADVLAEFSRQAIRYDALMPTPGNHRVLRADYAEMLAVSPLPVGAVYADPPYTRDHYSRFYHVLETIALGDDPAVSTVLVDGARVPSRALYRQARHQSPFSIRSRAPGAFRQLFAGVAAWGVPLVLSYSPYANGTAARPAPRVVTIDDLVAEARRHNRNVEVTDAAHIAHSRMNRVELNRVVDHGAEIFVVCRP